MNNTRKLAYCIVGVVSFCLSRETMELCRRHVLASSSFAAPAVAV